jgi:hypothetical protein
MAPPKNAKNRLFVGSFIHSKKLDALEYLHETAVCVDTSGKIVAVEPDCDLTKAREVLYTKLGWDAEQVDVDVAQEGEFFFPGFIGEDFPSDRMVSQGYVPIPRLLFSFSSPSCMRQGEAVVCNTAT